MIGSGNERFLINCASRVSMGISRTKLDFINCAHVLISEQAWFVGWRRNLGMFHGASLAKWHPWHDLTKVWLKKSGCLNTLRTVASPRFAFAINFRDFRQR